MQEKIEALRNLTVPPQALFIDGNWREPAEGAAGAGGTAAAASCAGGVAGAGCGDGAAATGAGCDDAGCAGA